MKKKIFINFKKCLGCRSCELACAVTHSSKGELYSAIYAGEKPGHRIKVEVCNYHAVPVHCNHCEEAPCMLVCPTGAIHRENDEGPVLIDSTRCIGCKMCVQACPFGMIDISFDGKSVLKCDMCIERLAEGKEPACVAACITKALYFGEEEEVNKKKRKKVAEQIVKAQEQQTESE